MIWFKTYTIEELQSICKNTLVSFFEIKFLSITEDSLIASMPVNAKTVQPVRILHGGASVVLAESLGSLGAYMTVDPDKYLAVGLEINANHIKSVPEGGEIIAEAKAIHLGKSTQIWQCTIKDSTTQKLVCVSRLTVAILEKK